MKFSVKERVYQITCRYKSERNFISTERFNNSKELLDEGTSPWGVLVERVEM